MMAVSVHRAGPEDVAFIARTLRRRRGALLPYAPVFWRPAEGALATHEAYLKDALEGSARAYRTAESVLVAMSGDGAQWCVDDVAIPDGTWIGGEGQQLWDAFAADCAGGRVRFVVPTYEPARAELAERAGLTVEQSWWLRELPDSGGGEPNLEVNVEGAEAVTAYGPPVYAPPGPMLMVHRVTDPARAVESIVTTARRLGCAGVVLVDDRRDANLPPAATAAGLRRHCDFYEGSIRSTQ